MDTKEERPKTADSENRTMTETPSEKGIPVSKAGELDKAADAEKGGETSEVRPAAQQPPDFPDGGLEAWTVVAGAWLVSFCTWGYVNAYGVYQDYYQLHQLSSYSPSDISWIGSLQLAMIFWGGLPCGKLFDMGYLRPIMIVGSVLTVFSLMMTSLAHTYCQIILAQGVALGMGLGILFIPSLSCVSHYFRRRRALANGVLATGSSSGGIVFPIMLNKLANNPRIGFAWAVRATGFVVLGMLLLANFLLKTRLPPRKNSGPLIDFRVFRDVNYSILTAGCWFILFGLYLPFFYLQEYAIEKGVNENLAFYSLTFLNAASVFGRTIPNYLADHWGPLNVLGLACFFSGIMIFVFLALSSAASVVVFALFFGFFSGTYVSGIAPCVATLTHDMRDIGLRVSMFFGIQGFAALLGTPINGALIARQNGSFVGAVIFSGVSVFLGVCILSVARTRHARFIGSRRA